MTPPVESGPGNSNGIPPDKALRVLRIIWFALLLGPILFLGVIVFVILPHHQAISRPLPVLNWVCAIMLVTVVPTAFAVRAIILRRSPDPAARTSGNIVFWAACEGIAFFGLIAAILNGSLWPTIVMVMIALGCQALTFPTRRYKEPD